MTPTRAGARAFLQRALERGKRFNDYDARTYQTTAAHKAATELVGGRHAVLTLPTGTGKTVICGMAAALFLEAHPGARAVFTAPRRALLSQLHERSRWLNPTSPVGAVGVDPREDDRHVVASFHHSALVFGMPEFLANRLTTGVVPADLVARTRLLIIDEFDAFLTLRYQARRVAVTFHDALAALIAALPDTCRLLLVSATTPEIVVAADQADADDKIDANAQTAFRRFLDETFDPAYVAIAPRYYAEFVPHAQITALAVEDTAVKELDRALSEEIGLLLNWISGEVGFHIDPAYVLPRLAQIQAGKLGLTPGGHRGGGAGALRSLLSRLQLMIHLPDFVYEDMAEGVDWAFEETSRWTRLLDGRMPVKARRVVLPEKEGDRRAMRADPRGKFEALFEILHRHPNQRGVVFFRNIRILRAAAERLSATGRSFVEVHGEQRPADNDRALAKFRATPAMLLLITRDTGSRGLDLPEGDFAVFYSPKSREDVTWQEVSRIRSTVRNRKHTYILCYAGTGEVAKMEAMLEALGRTTRSTEIEWRAAGLGVAIP